MSDHKTSRKSAQKKSWHIAFGDNLLFYLFLSLVFLLFVVPIVESLPFAGPGARRGLLRLGITAVLVSAAIATRRRRAVIAICLFVAAVAAPLTWVTMFVHRPYLFAFSCVLESLFFVAMAIMILASVMQKHLATIHSIFGAISAYLLLGLAWAVLYWALDHVDEGSLRIDARHMRAPARSASAEVAAFSQFTYFSFVTMSTLGYGDITPQKPLAQTLTWMQSITGQFYMAVLVALLVSEIPRRHRDKTP